MTPWKAGVCPVIDASCHVRPVSDPVSEPRFRNEKSSNPATITPMTMSATFVACERFCIEFPLTISDRRTGRAADSRC